MCKPIDPPTCVCHDDDDVVFVVFHGAVRACLADSTLFCLLYSSLGTATGDQHTRTSRGYFLSICLALVVLAHAWPREGAHLAANEEGSCYVPKYSVTVYR
jgi:hypothetical protein